MSFVARRENFLQWNARHRPAEFLDLGRYAVDLVLATVGLRDDSGNRLAMSRDNDGFAALDRIEQAG
jgi:hypothetical protein